MAAVMGAIDTRVLLAIGDGEPAEVGTLTTELHATGRGASVGRQHSPMAPQSRSRLPPHGMDHVDDA